ncbi:GNAT family N-acetyltransferase [Tenacibaculum piscium]|uniref:Acetyltransferase, GNAT family n=1 Tax=Tenacibaculum piscium TaxID=1458515 RepID=A0A2H1YIZ5_9FLAO|nr:GNAT family N-acetyltransferase [Tenacibaculum piscium]MBE7628653.1 GNAT family N-acetyltransferase [Tenacibaculum piscium]MBE7669794.1 GNAT family N-acetyltransferase [Tenacibaculum piscium]MBE7684618.1 GNAT family N-acetyltransferase [Tenacibaculum piscium]SOS75443.1 Acetyltransferase, GNAT family [Tenacibaculum piscium]
MKIRHSITDDLKNIMTIIHYAQRYLASLNIDQWQDGYPDKAQINKDIENKESYVLENEEQQIVATFMFTSSKESAYNSIDGTWLTTTDATYGVIHRVAVAENCTRKGIAEMIITYCEKLLQNQAINSMRIDTHTDNLGMQYILKKINYSYCGIITLDSGATRLSYEKLLS